MVRHRTIVSLIGMAIGMVIVAGGALAAGIELFPALALSLIGVAFGGWLAERYWAGEFEVPADRQDGTGTA